MPETRIGTIIHYWPKAGAAQIELVGHTLHIGDRIRIKRRGHEFVQVVESLEVDHAAKTEGRPGDHVAVAVMEPVRLQDEVWRLF